MRRLTASETVKAIQSAQGASSLSTSLATDNPSLTQTKVSVQTKAKKTQSTENIPMKGA